MPSYSRELAALGLLGAALWLPHCSQLTKVDWSLIPPAGGMSSAGRVGAAGEAAAAGENLAAGEGGMGGAAGVAGESGAAGEPDSGGAGRVVSTGGGGAAEGGIGGGSGGTGALGGNGGGSGGEMIIHPTCNTAPTAAPESIANAIVLFDGGPGMNGARGGRVGLDQACVAAKNSLSLPGNETHAVISVSLDDEIYDMQMLYHVPLHFKRVLSPLGIEIASDWTELWRVPAIPSLVCTGVMPPGVKTWLSGSNKVSQGMADPTNPLLGGLYGQYEQPVTDENNGCDGWTSAALSAKVKARVGSAIAHYDSSLNSFFFLSQLTKSCDVANDHVLCATYDRAP